MKKDNADIIAANKSRLVGLAYRFTGSMSEAEDIAQEALMKWLDADKTEVQSPEAWLTRVTTNLSLDYLKSARVQREQYIGPWLPEPFLPEEETPEIEYELDESISMALLLVLEQLNPAERACYVLHDIFAYNFSEVAALLERSEASCRKLASRARDKVSQARTSNLDNRREHQAIIRRFIEAMKAGDMAALESLLSRDVTFHSDGGGKAIAARQVIQGLDKVCRFIVRGIKPYIDKMEEERSDISQTWFNGSPGYVIWYDGQPQTAFNFVIRDGRITAVHTLRNPDKLRFFSRKREGVSH